MNVSRLKLCVVSGLVDNLAAPLDVMGGKKPSNLQITGGGESPDNSVYPSRHFVSHQGSRHKVCCGRKNWEIAGDMNPGAQNKQTTPFYIYIGPC